MILVGKPKNLEKTFPSATLSTTDPTGTDMGVNLDYCSEIRGNK
jgi:hypothetical protein